MLIFPFLLMAVLAFAQIPNAGFEQWTGNEPAGWSTNNANLPGSTTKCTTAHSGSYSAQISTMPVATSYAGGNLTSGDGVLYFATGSLNPPAFNGWYQLSANGGDYVAIDIATKCGNTGSGAGVLYLKDNTSVWKQFSVCIYYPAQCGTDSAQALIWLTNAATFCNAGTSARIDDLSFGACVTAVYGPDNIAAFESLSPNPASAYSDVIYALSDAGNVNIALYDLSGRMVQELLPPVLQAPGRYKVPAELSGLEGGLYLCVLTVNGQAFTKKLMVAK